MSKYSQAHGSRGDGHSSVASQRLITSETFAQWPHVVNGTSLLEVGHTRGVWRTAVQLLSKNKHWNATQLDTGLTRDVPLAVRCTSKMKKQPEVNGNADTHHGKTEPYHIRRQGSTPLLRMIPAQLLPTYCPNSSSSLMEESTLVVT